MVIAGSPETVRQRMEELIRSVRVGHVFCLLHSGNQPDEKTRHSTRLFAERVMPGLRDLWPDWRDDGRRGIKPLEQRGPPAPGGAGPGKGASLGTARGGGGGGSRAGPATTPTP